MTITISGMKVRTLAEKSPYHRQMRTLHYKSLAGAAALALATFGLAGCSSDDSTNQDAASQATTSAPQEVSATESKSTPPSSGTDLTQDNFLERTTNAMLNETSYHANITVEAEGATMVLTSDILKSDDPSEMVIRTTTPIDDFGTMARLLLIDNQMYMQMPQTEGKWVVLNSSSPEFDNIKNSFNQSDITATIEKMKNMSSAITDFTAERNFEVIDGVSTTKLALILDAKQYLGDTWDSSVGDTMRVSYFVGPDDLIRRLTMAMGPALITMDISNWGEPLDVTAPSADEIITLDEMSQQEG